MHYRGIINIFYYFQVKERRAKILGRKGEKFKPPSVLWASACVIIPIKVVRQGNRAVILKPNRV